MRRLLAVSLAINVLAAVYVVRTAYVAKRGCGVAVRDSRATPAQAKQKYHRQRVAIFESLRDAAVDADPTVLLAGDSLIETFEWNEHFRDRGVHFVNRGVKGDRLARLIDRYDATFGTVRRPARILLLIGANDIAKAAREGSESFVSDYEGLLQRLLGDHAAETICVQSILPMRNDDAARSQLFNQQIVQINRRLESYAQANGLCYVDVHSHLLDDSGQLREEYSFDGIHLSAEGYGVWMSALSPHLPGSRS